MKDAKQGVGASMGVPATVNLRPQPIPVFPVCLPGLPFWNARVADHVGAGR